MTPECQVCGAPMLLVSTENPYVTVAQWVCSKWAVHPLMYFGTQRAKEGAPARGVPR